MVAFCNCINNGAKELKEKCASNCPIHVNAMIGRIDGDDDDDAQACNSVRIIWIELN